MSEMLRFRNARRADLEECVSLLHPALRIDRRIRAGLAGLWGEWLRTGSARFVVIENVQRRHPGSIEGFGASVFVREDFAAEIWNRPRPHLAATLYEEVFADNSPVLSEAQTGSAVGGLDLVVLHFGLRNHDVTLEPTQRVLQCGSAAFYLQHNGYRVRSIVSEVFGRAQGAYMRAGGFQPLADFRDPHSTTELADDSSPLLFGLRKEWVEPGAVNSLSFLFHPPEPVLGLSPSVKRVLARALLDESDEEIATALGLSRDAVKESWRRAFEQVHRVAPHLLRGESTNGGSRRGAEKRRHLLSYLRLHLEECRPR